MPNTICNSKESNLKGFKIVCSDIEYIPMIPKTERKFEEKFCFPMRYLTIMVIQFISRIYYPIPPIPVTAIIFEVGFSFFATVKTNFSICSERPMSSLDNLNSLPS